MSLSSAWPLSGKLRDEKRIKHVPSRFSSSQIKQWLTSIGFHLPESIDSELRNFPTTLENLEIIDRLHIVKYPYENTTMHYSAGHDMDISPEGLFQRLIIDGKGSYCFGMNVNEHGLLEALRGLGYRVYSGGARSNWSDPPTAEPAVYSAIIHMVLFVQPGDDTTTYLVDVGSAGAGPSRPILLSADPENVVMGTSLTESHRLTRGQRSISSIESNDPQVDWRLEVLIHTGKKNKTPVWGVVYTFAEAELFENDYQALNFVVAKMPGTKFSDDVIFMMYFWLSDEEARGLGGDGSEAKSPATRYMGRLGVRLGAFNKHVGAQSERVATARTEKERREALKRFCGFEIAEEDLEHIRGTVAELRFDEP